MKRARFSEEQVAYALRQAESGTAVADVCRQLGVCRRKALVDIHDLRTTPRGARTSRRLRGTPTLQWSRRMITSPAERRPPVGPEELEQVVRGAH